MSEYQASVDKLSYIKENFKTAAYRDKGSDKFVLPYDEVNKRAIVMDGSDFHLTRADKGHAVIEGKLDKMDEEELTEIYDLVKVEVEARGKEGEKSVLGNLPFGPNLDLINEESEDEEIETDNPFLPNLSNKKKEDKDGPAGNPFLPDLDD